VRGNDLRSAAARESGVLTSPATVSVPDADAVVVAVAGGVPDAGVCAATSTWARLTVAAIKSRPDIVRTKKRRSDIAIRDYHREPRRE
jgi:hypothetical protein